MKQSRKLQVLRQLQDAIGRGERPKPRAVGLTEKEFEEMAAEDLFELTHGVAEPQWFDYTIEGLNEPALGLLSSSEPLPPSRAARICRALGIELWDLVKIPISLLIGYYFGKYFK